MKKLSFFIIFLILLIPTSSAARNADPRTVPSNYINVDFDKAQLSELVLMVSEYTGSAFVFNDQITMPVTWSQKRVFKDDVAPTFLKVLTSLGFTVQLIEGSNNFYSIDQDATITANVSAKSYGTYQMKHTAAESVKDSAEILYGDKLAVGFHEDNQVVSFSGSADLVQEFIQLLQRIDQPPLNSAPPGVASIRLQNISVRTAIVAINNLHLFEDPSVFPDYWNRSVIVYGTTAQQDIVHAALSAIDLPQEGWVDQVAFLQTVEVEQAQVVLQELYPELEIRKIAADRILISGEESLVDKCLGTVTKIDGTGLQVRVEAVIAYLTDREFRELGIRLSCNNAGFSSSLNDGLSSMLLSSNPGLLIDFFDGFLSLDLAAKDSLGHGEILSSPVLTVLNGHDASILVGRNVPFISRANVTQDSDDSVSTSIERHDIGLNFKVTPVIQPDGEFITLTVFQELSNVTDDTELSQDAVDIVIDKKTISTTVLMGDGDTIFLGGLRSDESGIATDRIPFLGELPLIGRLFTYEVEKKEKRHLVVSLRCNVISKPKS